MPTKYVTSFTKFFGNIRAVRKQNKWGSWVEHLKCNYMIAYMVIAGWVDASSLTLSRNNG